MKSWGWASKDEINTSIEEIADSLSSCSLLCEHTGAVSASQEESSHWNLTMLAPWSQTPSLQTWENKFLLWHLNDPVYDISLWHLSWLKNRQICIVNGKNIQANCLRDNWMTENPYESQNSDMLSKVLPALAQLYGRRGRKWKANVTNPTSCKTQISPPNPLVPKSRGATPSGTWVNVYESNYWTEIFTRSQVAMSIENCRWSRIKGQWRLKPLRFSSK